MTHNRFTGCLQLAGPPPLRWSCSFVHSLQSQTRHLCVAWFSRRQVQHHLQVSKTVMKQDCPLGKDCKKQIACRELVQLAVSVKRYISSLENGLEMLMIGLVTWILTQDTEENVSVASNDEI